MMRHVLGVLLIASACKSQSSAPSPEGTVAHAGSTGMGAPSAARALNPAPANHGVPPSATAPRTLEKLPDGRVALGPFALQIPSGWTEQPSTSNMRAAQFQLPAPEGAEAELVVYHFGASGAGSVDANIDRWLSQFQQADGSSVTRDGAKIDKATYAGQEATLVSVSGRYVATPPGGGEKVDKAGQSLFAAIIPSPEGPYYFRLIGDQAAVEAEAPRLREALSSLQLRSSKG